MYGVRLLDLALISSIHFLIKLLDLVFTEATCFKEKFSQCMESGCWTWLFYIIYPFLIKLLDLVFTEASCFKEKFCPMYGVRLLDLALISSTHFLIKLLDLVFTEASCFKEKFSLCMESGCWTWLFYFIYPFFNQVAGLGFH